jgi:hypothetical protein
MDTGYCGTYHPPHDELESVPVDTCIPAAWVTLLPSIRGLHYVQVIIRASTDNSRSENTRKYFLLSLIQKRHTLPALSGQSVRILVRDEYMRIRL